MINFGCHILHPGRPQTPNIVQTEKLKACTCKCIHKAPEATEMLRKATENQQAFSNPKEHHSATNPCRELAFSTIFVKTSSLRAPGIATPPCPVPISINTITE